MKNILLLTVSIILTSCSNYTHEIPTFHFPWRFTLTNGEKIEIAALETTVIMPIWEQFPQLYFYHLSDTSLLINECYSARNSLNVKSSSYDIDIFFGGLFTIGNKRVPYGYIILLESPLSFLYVHQVNDSTMIEACSLNDNKYFITDLLVKLKGKQSLIINTEHCLTNSPWRKVIGSCNTKTPLVRFNLNETDRILLIKSLERMLVIEKKTH